jgi:hypothetical protein
MSWLRTASLVLVLGSVLAVTSRPAVAAPDDDSESPAHVAYAAGATAFKAKNYEEAARQFEAADDLAPAAPSLRLAIRSRAEAGDGAQAASLAALAISLYSGDDKLGKVARETIARFGPKLQEIDATCSVPCTLIANGQPIHGAPSMAWTVYVDPGATSVGASFGEKKAAAQSVDATAGGSTSLKFEPKKAHPVDDTPSTSGTGGATSTDGTGNTDTPPDGTDPTKPKKHWGIHPAAFGVALGVTAVLGATTIWSGVDAINNPGADTVKKDCVGLGTSCPAYQAGLAHQQRTNILIGVTAGTGAVTIILAIVTNWHGPAKKEDDNPPPPTSSSAALRISEPRLWLDVPDARSSRALLTVPVGAQPHAVSPAGTPGAELLPDGAIVGVSGRFF